MRSQRLEPVTRISAGIAILTPEVHADIEKVRSEANE